MRRCSLTAAAVAATLFGVCGSVAATPLSYVGTAEIVSLDSDDNLLPDFLAATPALTDLVSFKVTYDADTLLAPIPVAPDATLQPGGLTAIELTLNGVTLSADTVGPGLASILATQSPDPDQFGIPGFSDGFSITGGPDLVGKRWAVNLFFFDFGGAAATLPSLNGPSELPNPADFEFSGFGFRSFGGTTFDGFGALLRSLEPAPVVAVPAPASALLVLMAGLALSRKRSH